MGQIEIINHSGMRISQKRLEDVALKALKMINSRYKISIALLDEEEMRKVNFTYRGIDKATDGLGFSYADEPAGEILLCPAYMKKQSIDMGVRPQVLYDAALVHSLLHIHGYDHKTDSQHKKMEALEKEIGLGIKQ